MNGHIPVMLTECLEALAIKPQGVYADMTLGLGGHARALCERLDGGRLIAFDKDEEALRLAQQRLEPYAGRVSFVHADYRFLGRELDKLGVSGLDGALADLGVSSLQLDETERGFSYHREAALDMRMDRSSALTAAEIVNEWAEPELERILRDYGEERFAGRIARAIVRRRPLRTTTELAETIAAAMPAASRREAQHPARRSFQGIRMAVNDELGGVAEGLNAAIAKLNPGGRLCVLTFHSIEDRLVKQIFQEQTRGCTCPPDFPVCVCGRTPAARTAGRQPRSPGEAEKKENPRARSAKLRVCEKL